MTYQSLHTDQGPEKAFHSKKKNTSHLIMQKTKGSWHTFSSGRGSGGEEISLGIAGVWGDDPILGSAVTQTGPEINAKHV